MAKGAAVGVAVGMSVIVILVGTAVGNDDGSRDGSSDGWREGAVAFSCAMVVVVLLMTTRRHNATTSCLVFHIMVFLQETRTNKDSLVFGNLNTHTEEPSSTIKSSQKATAKTKAAEQCLSNIAVQLEQ